MGWALFRDVLLTLDYPNRTVVLASGDLPPTDGQELLPIRIDQNQITVPIDMNGADMWAQLDTCLAVGANLALPPESIAAAKWASALKPALETRGVLASVPRQLGRIEGEVRLGRHRIARPIVAPSGTPATTMIGAETLRHFAITFDLRNLRIRLQRQGTEPIVGPSVASTGFAYEAKGDGAVVTEVLPGSEAERAGVRVGDVIELLNGKRPQDKEALASLAGTGPIELEIRRDARVFPVTVPLTIIVP